MLRQLATGHIGQLIAEAGEADRRRPARFRVDWRLRHGTVDTADGSWAIRLACLIAGVRCVRNWTMPGSG